jgi:hypothetical protein
MRFTFEIKDTYIKNGVIMNKKMKDYIESYISSITELKNNILILCYFNEFKCNLWISEYSYNFIVSPLKFRDDLYIEGTIFRGTKSSNEFILTELIYYRGNICNNDIEIFNGIKDTMKFDYNHDLKTYYMFTFNITKGDKEVFKKKRYIKS